MKKIVVFIFKILLYPLRFLKIENYIIFESSPIFSDNTRVVYEALEKEGFLQNKRVFWILTDRDFDLYEKNQKMGFPTKNIETIVFDRSNLKNRLLSEFRVHYYLSKTKYYIFSNENFIRYKPKKNQLFFNLTHGISLKNTVGIYRPHYYWSKLLVLSEYTKTLREKSYSGGKDKMLILGFPRNDFLLREADKKVNVFEQDNFSKNIVWLPTFRRQKQTGRNDTQTDSPSDLPLIHSKKDMLELNDKLEELDVLLLIKPHPAQDLSYFELENLSNIRLIHDDDLLENDIHLYQLLSSSHGLITDYSSVYIDYLLSNKIIAFTIDDIEAYKNHVGFMVSNPEEFMPGHHLRTNQDLFEFLKDFINGKDPYVKERDKIRNLFHKYVDDKSTERVTEYIMEFEEEKS